MANQWVGISPKNWIKKQQERGVGEYRLFNTKKNRIVDTVDAKNIRCFVGHCECVSKRFRPRLEDFTLKKQ